MTTEEAKSIIIEKFGTDDQTAQMIIEKAQIGGEITDEFPLDQWLNLRFLPNCILIDERGYSEMCVDALRIVTSTAATDYGGSRQRDLGQLWADMTRGYLGEFGLAIFLRDKFQIDVKLGHEKGKLADFLPMDVHKIKRVGDLDWRDPLIKVSIKTTKFNGIWLDIPNDQFNHSDIHVQVKVDTGRDHLFAFFKQLSVFKDKVLKRGEDIGSLTKQESSELYDSLPVFRPILAYICGYVNVNDHFFELPYRGKKGRKNFTITSWNGAIRSGDLQRIKEIEGVNGTIKFEGIGKFAHDNGYLFNSGSLNWNDSGLNVLLSRL